MRDGNAKYFQGTADAISEEVRNALEKTYRQARKDEAEFQQLTQMSDAEKIKLLAKAVLELAKNGARTQDYDNEQMIMTGIDIEDEEEIKDILK